MARAIDIEGKSSRRRYYGKIGSYLRQGYSPQEARRRARGYAGGKTSRQATSRARGSPNELPREAREVYNAAYSTVLEETGDEGAATEAAWDAVGLAGYTRKDGQWMLDDTAAYRGLVQMDDWLDGMPESGPLVSEIQIARIGDWDHPQYGRFGFTDETLQQFVDNFYGNVRGVDLAVDVSHNRDGEAAGWFKDLFKRGSELWARVEWTSLGEKLLRDGTFRYFSPEFVSSYSNPETGAKVKNVLQGGGLTNRPFIKGMAPVMLSEDLIGELVCWPVAGEDDSETGDVIAEQETDMKLSEQARDALKLSEEATPEEIGVAVDAFLAERSKADEDAKKLSEENTALTDVNKQLTERVSAVETSLKTAKWESYRDGKIQSGHLTKALAESFEPLYLNDPEQATKIIDALPQSVDLSERGTSGTGGGENGDDAPDTLFLSEVTKYQTEKDVGFDVAMSEVTKARPDLAAAYHAHARGQAQR